MSTRHQTRGNLMFAALLILTMFISACDSGGSSRSPADRSNFVSAAPVDSKYTYDNGDGLAPLPTGVEADDSGADDIAREIEEADIIKIEGTRIYILNQYRGLFIGDISDPDRPSILGRLNISGEPVDMYIRDGRAYVIVSLPQYLYYGLFEVDTVLGSLIPQAGSRMIIVDVGNPASPMLAGTVDLDGRITDSRIVGDILYVVSSEDNYYGWEYDVAVGAARDTATGNGSPGTYVASIDISDPARAVEVDREDLEGASRYIHVTDAAIFVPSTQGYYDDGRTTITYVDISDPDGNIRPRGKISIPGSVQDKFKMDYAAGYFRVCAYEWNQDGGKSSLHVIDVNDPDNMIKTGSVELGHGEQLFATRFDGDRAYMVTFEQVDPLWVIDLSDPANPLIKGELTVPGWSTHIEPRGDRLIALGVDNENGWRVSVSLFDVTDPADPGLVERVSFGDTDGWSSSMAYDDVKALTIIDDMELILLPYSTSSWKNNQYTLENRLQLIDYAPGGLEPRGWVSQDGDVLRSRNVEGRLFSVSGRQLQVIDASDRDNPAVTASLSLMENIVDFEPINSSYGVRVVQNDAGVTRLQAVPMQDPEYGRVTGEIALEPDESFAALLANGDMVYVVSNYWNYPGDGEMFRYDLYYEGATRVTVYDFDNIALPVKRGRVELEGNYYPVSPPDIYGILYPYYYPQGEFLRLGPEALVFVKPPRNYDYPILYADADSGGGEGAPAEPMLVSDAGDGQEPVLISDAGEGEEPVLISDQDSDGDDETTVTAVDLSSPDAPAVTSRTVVTYSSAGGWFVNNNILCFSYFEEQDDDEQGRPQVSYFLGRLDLNDMAAPVELPGIGMPGTCLDLSADGARGYTLNMEWTGTGEDRAFSFNTIRLNGDDVELLDTVNLGSMDSGWYYGYDYMLSGSRAYFNGFGSSSGEALLTVIDLTDPLNLKDYGHALGENLWLSLMDASGTSLFVRASDSVICYNTADPGVLTLDGYRSPGGWGNRVVFSGGRAYVPMGYYGLWIQDIK